MKLNEVIKNLTDPVVSGDRSVEVSFITADSRQVKEGALFVAVSGSVDGHTFIDDAIKNGAVAIVAESAPNETQQGKVSWVHTKRTKLALADIANAFNGYASDRLKEIGVTGTNGKTTTTYLIHHIMKDVWRRAGLIGTIRFDNGLSDVEATHTTPGAVKTHELLGEMVNNDCRGMAMEVSSHGIEQQRVRGVNFDVGVFTNLTQDHLDYHGSMEAYFKAKLALFEQMADLKEAGSDKRSVAVINTDDSYGQRMVKELGEKLSIWTYGMNAHSDFKFSKIRQTFKGTNFQLDVRGKSYLVQVPLIGKFNVYNVVSAITACAAAGMKVRDAVKALSESPQVPGRMENVGNVNGMCVFVDYAHTPDALKNACLTMRELEPRNLITVFGCGGDRDTQKRALMGEAAAENSEFCIVTSDNPRSEDPESIIKMIEAGMKGKKYHAVVDRAEAIQAAIDFARPGDLVLIAGKGHETYQEFTTETLDFDDRLVAKRVLKDVRVGDLKERMAKIKEQEQNAKKFTRRDDDRTERRDDKPSERGEKSDFKGKGGDKFKRKEGEQTRGRVNNKFTGRVDKSKEKDKDEKDRS